MDINDSEDAVKEEMEKGLALFKAKNLDYGNDFFEQKDTLDGWHNIKRKFARLKNLYENGHKIQVNDEALEDTLRDLGNYCYMELAKIKMHRK